MGGILLKHREPGNYFTVFYARRALRILPLYVLAVFMFWLVKPGGEPAWALLTFTQNIFWAVQGRFGDPYIGVTWSLALEEQFYLILPLLLLLTPRRILPFVLVALIVVAPALRVALYLNGYGYFAPSYMLLPCRMDALFLGVLMAWALRNEAVMQWLADRRLRIKIAAVVLLAGLGAMSLAEVAVTHPLMTTVGYSWIAVTYACVVFLIITTQREFPHVAGVFAPIGLACFSLYLFHIPVFAFVGTHWRLLYSLGVPYSWLNWTIVYLTCLAVVAVACWFLVERPAMRFAHRRWRYSAAVPGGYGAVA